MDAAIMEERLSKLEMQLDALRRTSDADHEILKATLVELAAVRTELTRYKGFIGGVLFIISAIATLVEIFGKKIGIY